MKIGAVSLILSALALGFALFGLTQTGAPTERAPIRMDRVAELERKVAELSRRFDRETEQRGRIDLDASPLPSFSTTRDAAAHPDMDANDAESPLDTADRDEALAAIVDAAVDRKTKQVLDEMRIKENKKPAMDVFASMLELTPEQRAATERVVVEGQRKVHEILDTPTADGTNLMDDLIDIVARGFAQPGKDHGWGRFFARVVGEKIPGTDETYGARIESVKAAMRTSFKRDWSEAQYEEFQAWGVDPTEIEKVPGSPNAALVERITERARELGAEIPTEK